MDVNAYNRRAWDAEVERGSRWTIPVSQEAIAGARRGDWAIVLTPVKSVPKAWFPPLAGCRVLGLASGGGQQGPILAAAGAQVTVLDGSRAQLQQDEMVAEREGLSVRTVLGDMADLSAFADESFELIVHPCSNCFVPEIRPVWKECSRVLCEGGVLMSGFANPAQFIFDAQRAENKKLMLRHKLPYTELRDLTEEERTRYVERNEPLMFGHTLQDQIGGQLDAGFVLTDLYEDSDPEHPLSAYMPTYVATRAVKSSR